MRLDPSAFPVVLAVDDDAAIRDALGLVLEDDCELVVATDGAEAVETLAARPIDVVLLDLIMPRMHGHDVLGRIRRDHSRTPVIVLSAVADVPTIVTSMKLGAWDYVTKPWQDDELRARVHGAVRERRELPGVLLVSDDVASLAPLELALEARERVLATSVTGALRSAFSAKAMILRAQAARVVHNARLLHQRFPSTALMVVTDMAGARLLESLNDVPLASVIETDGLACALRDLVHFGLVRDVTLPHGAVEAAIRFIAARYGSRITVADVAQAASLSEHHLAHVFRTVTGLSVKDYIIRFRVAIGRRLLAETTEKVDTIAGRIGFADASNFSRMFKHVDGVPPGEFRRSHSLPPLMP